jgi:hypothetical protein
MKAMGRPVFRAVHWAKRLKTEFDRVGLMSWLRREVLLKGQ